MSNAVLEEVLEETKALPPEGQQQLLKLLSSSTILVALGIRGLRLILEKLEALTPDERQHLLEALRAMSRPPEITQKEKVVHSVRGKYAGLSVSSDDFAAQKQEEIRREDHP